MSFLKKHKNEKHISLHTIAFQIEHLDILHLPLQQLRSALVNFFIGSNSYLQIMNRRQFYDHLVDVVSVDTDTNSKVIKPPPESCISKTFRIICTASPPPYYTEYRNKDIDGIQVTADFIHSTRARYGYSRRPNTVLRVSTVSRMSEYSEVNNDDEEKLSKMLRESSSRASIAKSPVLRSLRYRASSVSTTKVKNKKLGSLSSKIVPIETGHSGLEEPMQTDV